MEETPFGRYRLVELLGRGGMGEVWRAHDTVTERLVALKLLPASFAGDRVFEERFRREARAAAGLDEPHVVPIHDFGEIESQLYVSMRLIKGLDLQMLVENGPLEPARAVGIIEQIASALYAAHRIGLVHRDVKPSNILVTEDDFAYLIDFGIARAAEDTRITTTGAAVGTWAYMAPERFRTGACDASADIYALACVLYQCLTGQLPFPGTTLEQIAVAHMVTPPPRPSITQPGVPAELDAVVGKGMAKDPTLRYTTTLALARAARAALNDQALVSELTRQDPQRTEAAQLQPTESPASPGDSIPSSRASPPGLTDLKVHSSPTEQRSSLDTQQPDQGAPAPGPRNKKLLWGGIAAAVVVVVVVLTLVVVMASSEDSGSIAASPSPSGPPPNAGPFTGAYTADFGPRLTHSGKPLEGGRPGWKETWRLRSLCRPTGCVAVAAAGEIFPVKEMVFDDVGGSWLVVATSQDKCLNTDVQVFEVISLNPRPDGTLAGEWTRSGEGGCFSKRIVTFTRTGDTDVTILPDPATQPPRAVSPAEALHGRYRYKGEYPTTGQNDQSEGVIRTDCLRTGERCISFFHTQDDQGAALVFANGKWTSKQEADAPCVGGGTDRRSSHVEFPFPQPPQNPITLLSGHGRLESITGNCRSTDIEVNFVRIAD